MSASFRYFAGIVLAILLTLVSGLLHGSISQRWGYDQRMEEAAARLDLFPQQLGDWLHEDDYELSDTALELLECQGYIHRGYRHRATGDYVKLAIMVGPGSKMSIHVPEICFEANSFTLTKERTPLMLDDESDADAFWSVMFRVNDVSQRPLQVVYGWNEGARWVAPEMPRWSVAGAPVLYKLQLAYADPQATGTATGTGASDDRLRELLRAIVGAMQPLVTPPLR